MHVAEGRAVGRYSPMMVGLAAEGCCRVRMHGMLAEYGCMAHMRCVFVSPVLGAVIYLHRVARLDPLTLDAIGLLSLVTTWSLMGMKLSQASARVSFCHIQQDKAFCPWCRCRGSTTCGSTKRFDNLCACMRAV